tara:strand:- start:18318 stop:21176 length:2859 start_codon:yes stop_codon:yes gene_type:complete
MKKTNFFAAALLFATTLVAQDITETTLVKEASSNPMDIPYEKWELPNGLKVLIHEDHSDPIVQVHVTYHVGSNREAAGKSGFAHFFEHMMFQGSEHVADERHFKIVSDAGGSMNGNTTSDRTVYFQTVPTNYLETALWLEADRMGFMLNAVTQEKFENQRDAVKNEKYQNQINRPYGMSSEILGQTLYPPSHPYNWPVIGYVDDLDRATLQDLKDFFLRWYGPDNAILTISGDVTSEEVMPLVEKYFASINRGTKPVRRQKASTPRLSSDVYTGYTDNVYLPLTDIVFPTVPNHHKDEPALDMLAALMGDGNNSIFYKNFVKTEKAIQASVSHPCRELAGEFHFTVLTYPDWQEDPGIYFNNIEADIRNTIAEWEEKGFTDEELAMVKTEMETMMISQKTSVSSKASAISSMEWLGRGKNNIASSIQQYQKVTREDVMRVFNKYIKNKKAVIATVRPKSPFVKELDSIISINPNANLMLKEDPQYQGLVYNRPVDDFDRTVQPTAGAPKAPQVPKYYKTIFDNGIHVIGTQTSETPKVYLRLTLNGGSLLEEAKKVGLADFTASMMNESTKNKDAEAISVALRKLGSTIYFSTSGSETHMYIESLTKNLDATLALAKEKLMEPAFTDEDFKLVRKQNLEGLESQKKNAQYLASSAFQNKLFGETPFGRTATTKTMKKIKLKDIQAYYDAFYSPSVASLVVVGDIDEASILSKLDFLKNWKGTAVNVPTPTDFEYPAELETQIYLIDKEGSSQSNIFLGHKADKFDVAGDHFKSNIMNYPLGGGASGRLFLNLREDKGYTYGVYSFFRASKYTGAFTVFSSVKTEATDSALVEMFNELNAMTTTGVTADELASTKSSILNSEALEYESPGQKLGFLNKMLKHNLDESFIDAQTDVLNNITLDEINALAKAKIHPDKMTIVIVGNKYLIKKKLQNLQSNTDGMKYNFKVTEIKL